METARLPSHRSLPTAMGQQPLQPPRASPQTSHPGPTRPHSLPFRALLDVQHHPPTHADTQAPPGLPPAPNLSVQGPTQPLPARWPGFPPCPPSTGGHPAAGLRPNAAVGLCAWEGLSPRAPQSAPSPCQPQPLSCRLSPLLLGRNRESEASEETGGGPERSAPSAAH